MDVVHHACHSSPQKLFLVARMLFGTQVSCLAPAQPIHQVQLRTIGEVIVANRQTIFQLLAFVNEALVLRRLAVQHVELLLEGVDGTVGINKDLVQNALEVLDAQLMVIFVCMHI